MKRYKYRNAKGDLFAWSRFNFKKDFEPHKNNEIIIIIGIDGTMYQVEYFLFKQRLYER